ncbi:putative permease [Azospirillum fermentarium]|uniref:AEC family transporter n=1 Tax=Azospirillum fermentarium TaxID=1233114 RepID=UPI0022260DE4|nr:AEC family transporter [Azospirillum fermentarium]MCW2248822.1 putative permease [Azospirillum fermentarium]
MSVLAALPGIVNVVAPVFVVAAVGFAWIRARLPYDSAFITTFAVNVSTPCLVFSSLVKAQPGGATLAAMTTAAVATMGLAGLAGWLILKAARVQGVRAYISALSFPNAGNLGLPVCLFAFGEEGLSLAILYFAAMAVAQFTIGPALAAGRFDWRMVLRTPVIYAVAAALLAVRLDMAVPVWIGNTTQLLGGCAVPLMLFSLGVALARLRPAGAGRAAVLSALRLTLGLAAGFGVSAVLGLDGAMRGVVVLQSAMPVAVFNYLWALRYNNAPEEVAGMVLFSTAMAFAGLPLLLLAVMPG